MRILFVTHHLSYADHIAIAHLSAVAKERGHLTYFCTLVPERFCRTGLLEAIDAVLPHVVAYSVNVMGFQHAVAAQREACQRHSFVSILGGPQATFSPETFTASGMDAYCVGEGELAFGDFLDRVEHGLPYDDVPNLTTKMGVNPVRP
ncbi:MAG: cobalamin-dependent protein, partial [Candidatus Latescibacterota bacterium]